MTRNKLATALIASLMVAGAQAAWIVKAQAAAAKMPIFEVDKAWPKKDPIGREQLIQDGADGEDIGAAVERQTTHLLGRHIAELAL